MDVYGAERVEPFIQFEQWDLRNFLCLLCCVGREEAPFSPRHSQINKFKLIIHYCCWNWNLKLRKSESIASVLFIIVHLI